MARRLPCPRPVYGGHQKPSYATGGQRGAQHNASPRGGIMSRCVSVPKGSTWCTLGAVSWLGFLALLGIAVSPIAVQAVEVRNMLRPDQLTMFNPSGRKRSQGVKFISH